MFGVELECGVHSTILIFIMYGCLTLGGITALFILTKNKYAFKIGILYVLLSCLVTIPLHFKQYGNFEEDEGSSILNYLLLGAFLIHMIRNLKNWTKYCITSAGSQSTTA